MKKSIIAGNWKMNKTLPQAEDFFNQINRKIKNAPLRQSSCILCVPSPYLPSASQHKLKSNLLIGGQDVSAHTDGAYTGETSAQMLQSCSVDYCIVGHSERREYHHESNALLNKKLFQLQECDITPIYCIGENLEQREKGLMEKVLLTQLAEGLKGFDISRGTIIAYEPIWAIGTGKAATAQMAQDVHQLIRRWISENYSPAIAEQTHILYGGSMKPANIAELIAQPDIDGGLIGGAALEVESYWEMVKIAEEK